MQLSISELEDLCNIERAKIKTAVADLRFSRGPNNSYLYDSAAALSEIFLGTGHENPDIRLKRIKVDLAALELKKQEGKVLDSEEVVRGYSTYSVAAHSNHYRPRNRAAW